MKLSSVQKGRGTPRKEHLFMPFYRKIFTGERGKFILSHAFRNRQHSFRGRLIG